MIPMRFSTVFKSRRMALLWAAGILWLAYDVAASQPQATDASGQAAQATDVTGTPITTEDEQRLAEELKRL